MLGRTPTSLHHSSGYRHSSHLIDWSHLSYAARCFSAGTLAVLVLSFAGCVKKSLNKSELRTVTKEVVSAAQRITGRKSEITIHPEGASDDAADDIVISSADASQTNALKQAFTVIARRHKLSFAESTHTGEVRFDLAFNGNRTHTIAVTVPANAHSRPSSAYASGEESPRLAIIVDDMGEDRSAARSLFAMPFPLTISVIPHLPFSSEVAIEAYRRGDQVLLHLPMEAEKDLAEPGEIELRVGMNSGQVRSALGGMLETVPHVVGVNNHEGSRATADPALMESLMPELRKRGLFFIDSRTTAATVAYDTAQRLGVRSASRKVFLDDTQQKEAIVAQFDLAVRDALHDGSAIAIGHPHAATIAALAETLPQLEARGVHLVFASDLVQ